MRSYSDVNTDSSGDPGMMIGKNYSGRVMVLRWDKVNQLRLTGPATSDNKSVIPWRLGPEKTAFSRFLSAAPVFRGGTMRRVTFISALRSEHDPTDYVDIEEQPSPIMKLYEYIRRLSRADANIERAFLRGGAGRGAALPNPRKVYGFVQGINLRNDGGGTKPEWPCLFVLSASARQALVDMLNTEVKDYHGAPDNYVERFVSGDITHADTGRIVKLFNPDREDSKSGSVNWDSDDDKTKNTISKYACELGDVLSLPRLPSGEIKLAADRTLFTPWEDALRLMDETEMLQAVCSAFEDYPDILVKAFSDRLDLLPRAVRDAGARVSVQGGYNQAAPPPAPGVQQSQQSQQSMWGDAEPQTFAAPTGPAQPATAQAAVDWGAAQPAAGNAAPQTAAIDPGQFAAAATAAAVPPTQTVPPAQPAQQAQAPAQQAQADAPQSDMNPQLAAALAQLQNATQS